MKIGKSMKKRIVMCCTVIKNHYRTHLIGKLMVTIGIVVFLGLLIFFLPILGIKKEEVPNLEQPSLAKTIGDVLKQEGEQLVAQTTGKELYINTSNLTLKVKDTLSNKTWTSYIDGATDGSGLALCNIRYLGKDNNIYEWNTYDNCVAFDSYEIKQIEGGVQIHMNINEGESNNFYEYLPPKFSFDCYENFFLSGLDSLVEKGSLEKEQAEKYKRTLSLIYKKSTVEECYAVTYSGTPPLSAVNQLIETTKLLGYTTEMLIEDCAAFGFNVTFHEPAIFDITVEVYLEEDDFMVRIPTYEMVSGNDYYTIQNIELLPNFGGTLAKSKEDGYMFVPDGSGALLAFNSYNPTVSDYVRPVYNNDYLKDYYFMPEFAEELMMPIFGMIYGGDTDSTHGFLAIIEQGAETSYIHSKLASATGEGSASNKVYASFDANQCAKVKIYGPYSDNAATYLTDTGLLSIDYTIRYKLFGNPVTYFDMATSYRDYLKEEAGIEEFTYDTKAKVYIEAIGAVSLTKRFLGIPYDSLYSMTTYEELGEIMNELSDVNLTLQYSGGLNNGLKNQINNQANLVGVNGKASELERVRNQANKKGIDFFIGTNLSRVYEKGNGFFKRFHALCDYSNTAAQVYRYTPNLGIFDGYVNRNAMSYYMLAPSYLTGVVNDFMKDSTLYDSIYIGDLANMFYADYRFRHMVTVYEANEIIEKNLAKLKEEKKLALYDPKMEYVSYGEYAIEVSRESSDYATFAMTIPFRQLVMNGLTTYTTKTVNLSSKQAAYYVLQSIELGALPKFTISSKSEDVLKDSSHSYLYSIQFDKWKETIRSVYKDCEKAREIIGTTKISNHMVVAPNVFCTDYETGVSVITNYNLYEVALKNGSVIPGQGYIIIE